MKLNIIYYIFINPERYKVIVEGQLNDLKKCNMDYSNLFIHICSSEKQYIHECKDFIDKLQLKNIIYSESYLNLYEYPGLKILYDLSQTRKDEYFLYFHSKGMSFTNSTQNERDPFEKTTLRATFYYWKEAMNIFKNIININKIGLWPSSAGFIWVNFFYIRGSYLKSEPIIHNDRWYYESYIGQENTYLDCYSLTKNKVTFIHPDNIIDDDLSTINNYYKEL
jgi:hypothetical protein